MDKYLNYLKILAISSFLSCGGDEEPANSPPQISNRTFLMEEEIEAGSRVGFVSAFDPDNDPLVYLIISGNSDNTFELNSSSGELIVQSTDKIDFQEVSQYQLSVEVNDSKTSASATITINVEEANRPPVINNQTLSVTEDARRGIEIGTIEAIDPNGDDITFEIIGGNEDDLFEIEEGTGKLLLISTLNLDFEVKDSYILTILVTDAKSLVSSGPVTVNVVDTPEPNTTFELEDNSFTIQDGLIRELGQSANGFHTVRNYTLADGEFNFSQTFDDFVVNGGTVGVFGVLFSSNFISFNPGEFIYVDTATTTVGDVLGKNFIYSGTIIIDGNDDGSVAINEEDIVYGITAGSIKIISNGADSPTLNYNVEVMRYDVASGEFVPGSSTDLHFEYSGDYEYSDQRSRFSGKQRFELNKTIGIGNQN